MRTPDVIARMAHHIAHTHGLQVRPVLPVRDLDQAARGYEALGMAVDRWDDTYAWVLHDGHELLHLKQVAELDPATNHAEVYLFVDDVHAWHDRAEQAGLAPTPVQLEPWGLREFACTDASGNRLRLGCDA